MPEYVLRMLGRTRTRFFRFCEKVELSRKLFHVLSIGGVAALNHAIEDWSLKVAIIWVALVLGLIYEWLRKRYAIPVLRNLERKHEREGGRTAMVDFMVACAICVTIFPPDAVTIGLIVAATCDPVAAFVGQASEVKTRWRGSRKCVEGTLFCFVFAFLFPCIFYKMQYWPLLLLCGVLCAVVELKTKQKPIKRGPFKGHLSPGDNFYILLTACGTLSIVDVLLRH